MNQRGPSFRVVVLAALVTGCQGIDRAANPEQPSLGSRLTFLTRGGCVNSPVMIANLDQALRDGGYAGDYVAIDTATLAASDPRCGYGTPTILLDGRDIFGFLEPARGVRHVPM